MIRRCQRRLHLRDDDFLHGWRIERHVASNGVVKRCTQRIHVGEKRFRLTFDLFWSDVIRRAACEFCAFGFGIRFAGEAKVHQFRFVVGVEKNVARLDVAMQQVMLQCSIQSSGDLDAHIEHLQFRQRMELGDAVIQAALVSDFHDEVTFAIPFVKCVDVDDVRVVQLGAGASFKVETLEHLRIVEKFLLHQLHRNEPFQCGVPRAIDHAHAAGSDLAAQLELPELHRHHDGVTAFFARLGGEGRQVAGDERLRVAARARHHLQRFAGFTHGCGLVLISM